MEKLFLLSSLLFVLLTLNLPAQSSRTPLDKFIDDAETIVIVKCVKSGPVDILLRSRVALEVLLVVKGDPKLTTLSLNLRYGMQPGKNYLVRMPSYFEGESTKSFAADSVIAVSDNEDLAVLRTLSPQIVVLRTMNMRIDELESEIRRSTYELEGLKAIKVGN